MDKQELYIKYPSSLSEEKLAKRLGLYWDNTIQDWELVVSDFGRINDFLNLYQKELYDDDDKFTLMGLMVSSFDRGISDFNVETETNWRICKTILENECYLHYSIIKYWSLLEEKNTKNAFPITPYMREIWDKVEMNFL